MNKFWLVFGGVFSGIAATGIAIALGIQSSYYGTLATLNCLAGVGGALIAETVIGKRHRRGYISKRHLYEVAGQIRERYALSFDKHQALVGIEEFLGELEDAR